MALIQNLGLIVLTDQSPLLLQMVKDLKPVKHLMRITRIYFFNRPKSFKIWSLGVILFLSMGSSSPYKGRCSVQRKKRYLYCYRFGLKCTSIHSLELVAQVPLLRGFLSLIQCSSSTSSIWTVRSESHLPKTAPMYSVIGFAFHSWAILKQRKPLRHNGEINTEHLKGNQ